MLGLGAFVGRKLKTLLVAGAIFLAATAYHFFTVSSLEKEISSRQEEIVLIEKENNTLRGENSELAFQVDQIGEINARNVENLTAEIQRKDDRIDQYVKEAKQLRDDYNSLTEEKDKLRDLLSKHDLEYLAGMKPKLIENRMNKATEKLLKDLEETSRSN